MNTIEWVRLSLSVRDAEAQLYALDYAKYPRLTPAEIQTLGIDNKWMAALAGSVQSDLDRVSQTLTGRLRELAERYQTPLPRLTDEVASLAAKVEAHLAKMGAAWQ